METAVIMKRNLFNSEISQNSKTGFFSATDLVKAGNQWRIANKLQPIVMNPWFNNKSTKEFIGQLEKEFGKVKISGRGRGNHTWLHPYLFIDLALTISPTLKLEVYSWLYDELIKRRNSSGDSYKRMCGSLHINSNNLRNFPKEISDIARKIKITCGVEDWEHATERQLKLRERIQDNISLLTDVLRDNNQAVKIAIIKSMEQER